MDPFGLYFRIPGINEDGSDSDSLHILRSIKFSDPTSNWFGPLLAKRHKKDNIRTYVIEFFLYSKLVFDETIKRRKFQVLFPFLIVSVVLSELKNRKGSTF